MPEPHRARTVASLQARRRRLLAGLADFERRAETYRVTIAKVEAELHALGTHPGLVTLRKPILPIRARDFRWTVLRHLREVGAPVTSGELARRIIAECKIDAPAGAVRDTRKRVQLNLDALTGMGFAQRVAGTEGRGAGVRWGLAA